MTGVQTCALPILQAAVLLVKLEELARWSEARRANADFYNQRLCNIAGLTTPYIDPRAVSIYNQYTLVCDNRDALMSYLQDKGVGCAVYYPLPLHIQECFSELGYKVGNLPVSEELADKVLSLPIYPELTTEMKQYVVDCIKEFYA